MTSTPTVNKDDLTSHMHYMRPLDGIRGLACLLLIFCHIGTILQLSFYPIAPYVGALGVLVFFTLSGFLMSTLYVDKALNFDSGVKYAIARMARIAPAYWIAVIMAWAIYMLIPTPDFHYQMHPLMMVRTMMFGGNQGIFWSIPPEIQFYAFFFLLWFSWEKFKQGNYFWLLGTAILCSFFITTGTLWGGLTLPSKIHIFLFGFIAAFLPKIDKIKKVISQPLFQVFVTVAMVYYGATHVGFTNVYTDLLFPALIAIWIASMSRSTIITKVFETNTMRLVGAASFSIYLFHDPILCAMHDLGMFSGMPTMFNIAVMSIVSLIFPVAFHFLAEKKLNKHAKAAGLTCLEFAKQKWFQPRTQAKT